MNTMLSFEGIPPIERNTSKFFGMLNSLSEAILEFSRSKIWPDDVVPPITRYKYFIVAYQLDSEDLVVEMQKILDK